MFFLSQRFLTFLLVRNHVVSYDQLTVALKYFNEVWSIYGNSIKLSIAIRTINLKALGLLDSNALISIPQSSTRQLCKFLGTDRKAPFAGCTQRNKRKQGKRKTLLIDFFFQFSCIPYTFLITLKPSSNPQAFQQAYMPSLQSPSHNPPLHFILLMYILLM